MSAKPAPKKKGKGIDEFRSLYDRDYKVPKKIKAALADLGESWLGELEFMRTARVSSTDLADFRDEFKDHWVAVTEGRNEKRIWAGTKAFAAKLRERAHGQG